MVKLGYLEPFEIYRTNPPMIMPELAVRKKGMVYFVWAPTIKQEIDYLAHNSSMISFKNLYKYFIPKRWQGTIYGQGNRILKFDEDGEISSLIKVAHSKPNFKNVSEVTSYLPTVTVRPMKGLNVLVEQNYFFEQILNNERDRRIFGNKAADVMKYMIQDIEDHYDLSNPDNLLGKEYKDSCILIPMNLWFTEQELQTPEKVVRKATRNYMGWFLNQLSNVSVLKKFPRIILTYDRLVLILHGSAIPEGEKDPSGMIHDLIINFMKRTKNIKLSTDTDDADVESDQNDKASVSLAVAEQKTKDDAVIDAVMQATKIDPDTVSHDTKEKLKQDIKASARASITKGTSTQSPSDVALDPDVINPDTQINQAELDMIAKARLEGRSVQSQKRNELLKTKYQELKLGTTPLKDLHKEEKKYEIEPIQVKAHTINDRLKDLKSHEFEKSYNDNLAQNDLAAILLHFSHINPPLYLNKDVKVEDASTPMERVIRYDVEFEDEDRKRHRFHFLMPKLYREKYLYLNDQEMNLSHQKFPYPVTKTAPGECQLVTNYNKIFTERYGTNLSPRSTKLKKILGGADCPKCVKVERGDATIPNKAYLTTVEYDDLGTSMIKISVENKSNKTITHLYLITNEAYGIVNIEPPEKVTFKTYDDNGTVHESTKIDSTLIPLGVSKNGTHVDTNYFISGSSNIVYDQNGLPKGELSEFLVSLILEADPKTEELFKEVSAGTKFVYARSKIMAEWIPTILAISAADPNGLTAVLEKAKVKYQFLEKRPNVDKDATGVIPFQDGYLIYDRYPYENSLLLNGLLSIPTKEYSFYQMNDRDTYVELFDALYGRRTLFDAMRNFYYLMVDPITLNVLKRLNMPTDFTTLMIYCVGTLADNTFQIDSNYMNSRIRSNEIINVYLYKELATAWEKWSSGREEKFSIWERAVIQDLLTVQIVDPHSTLNVTLEAENDNLVKLKGPSGMNEDHSYTLEKRAYHPTMQGILALNTTPSGEVGIARHLTLNSNIDDARGFISVGKHDPDDYDGTELLSVGELLQTFGAESADMERVAMAMNQSKHLVPVAHQTPGLVSFDMERVIPYISHDFSFRAKQDGKVVEVKDELMIIQYKDGTYDDIDLSEHPDKNVDGGFFIMNQMVSKYKVGQTFKSGDILAYNPKYITTNDMFGDPCADVGCLARMVVESNGNVYEDSSYCTQAFAERATTKITRQKRVILSRFANIKYMAKIGQVLQPNDPLLTFDDTEDEFSSQLLATIAEEEGDEDEIVGSGAPVVSKTGGVLKDVYIYYTIPLNEMTPSMRKIVEAYDKDAKSRQKTLNKYRGTYDANTKLKPAERIEPDSQGKVKGSSVGDGVIIDFYVEYEDLIAPGDKMSALTKLGHLG